MRTPGASESAAHTSVEFGTAMSSSPFRLVPILVVETSTTGDAPVTMMFSVRPPTCSWASNEIVWPRTTAMLSRSIGRNPDSSKVSL